MGVVFHAHDRQQDADVALKVLLDIDPTSIHWIKKEFRAVADVSHPNLVTLFELFSSAEHWFFTMELLSGSDLLSYVYRRQLRSFTSSTATPSSQSELEVRRSAIMRAPTVTRHEGISVEAHGSLAAASDAPAPQTLDETRLREALQQLADALCTIHDAGFLHCDIKPANALVTDAGRLALLDFGLATHHGKGSRDSFANRLRGTPVYMSPEQAFGEQMTPASDWYAVGVMLYEALAGVPPHEGGWRDVLAAKARPLARTPRDIVPGVPEDLQRLCLDLLAQNPEDRPSGAEVLRRLGGRTALPRGTSRSRAGATFVGRDQALAALDDAFEARTTGRRVLVVVEGGPGIGKSALAAQHARLLARRQNVLTLASRCYERESIPFKAFDGVVDALGRHLLGLPSSRRAALLPADAAILAHVFPDLARQNILGAEPAAGDPMHTRQRAFAALREILARLAAEQAVVLYLDDIQWGDADSADLLAALLADPGLPLLVVLNRRAPEPHAGSFMGRLEELLRGGDFGIDRRTLRLAPLSPEESFQLALQLSSERGDSAEARARVISAEAEGNPLFVGELVRWGDLSQPSGTEGELTLEGVLRARLDELPPGARELLMTIAMLGRPVRQSFALKVSGAEGTGLSLISLLRAGHYVRTAGTSPNDLVEVYHDRVRETVIGGAPAAELQAWHRRIAQALEGAAGGGEAFGDQAEHLGALARHCKGAGDRDKAFGYQLDAARRSRALYAIRDALERYEAAVHSLDELSDVARDTRFEVYDEFAAVLRQVGDYPRAIATLDRCSALAQTDDERARAFIGRGHVYQEQGDSASAISELETALAIFGRRAPRKGLALGLGTVGQLIRRLFAPGPERIVEGRPAAGDGSGALARRPARDLIERQTSVLLVLIRIYYFADAPKLLWASLTVINLSRWLERDADRVVACAYYGAVLMGVGNLGRSDRYCRSGFALAGRMSDPLARGMATARLGTLELFKNELPTAAQRLREAAAAFQEAGEMWELQTCLMLQAVNEFLSSRFDQARGLFVRMGELAEELKAQRHWGWSRAWAPFCDYLLGRCDGPTAQGELERAIEASERVGDIANQIAAMMHAASISVREGNAEEAARIAARLWQALPAYKVRVPFLEDAYVAAAEAALFALERRAAPPRQRALRAIARRAVRGARRRARAFPYLRGPALRVQARLDALERGAQAAEPTFRQAFQALEASPNRWETGVAYLDAAGALPAARAQLAARAREIFVATGALAELRRVDLLVGATGTGT
jgi:tetratricopeptide (TPR) repeat protein